jgi:hypothetical protein
MLVEFRMVVGLKTGKTTYSKTLDMPFLPTQGMSFHFGKVTPDGEYAEIDPENTVTYFDAVRMVYVVEWCELDTWYEDPRQHFVDERWDTVERVTYSRQK